MVMANAKLVVEALKPHVKPGKYNRLYQVARNRRLDTTLVLENLNDPHNAAACLRTADAFGIRTVHVIESYNAFHPFDVHGASMSPTSKGSVKWLEVKRYTDTSECLQALRDQSFMIAASMVDSKDSVPLDQLPQQVTQANHGLANKPTSSRLRPRLAMVLGNEHRGVSRLTESEADFGYYIPQQGFVDSLNVSVSAGITLYAMEQALPPQEFVDGTALDELMAKWLIQSVRGADLILSRKGIQVLDL
eukprot:gb/GECG01014202.1/.p1 GENE.gb/GECG01014202.1/~~gb/GECG01014202.1/.p1  ORF type:complete len:248 (+),score=32.81 gb/GECG01014202.1/:1-744(+)